MVPFGALGFVPPWLAALGMSISSLVVVLNALRIGRGSEPGQPADRGAVDVAGGGGGPGRVPGQGGLGRWGQPGRTFLQLLVAKGSGGQDKGRTVMPEASRLITTPSTAYMALSLLVVALNTGPTVRRRQMRMISPTVQAMPAGMPKPSARRW